MQVGSSPGAVCTYGFQPRMLLHEARACMSRLHFGRQLQVTTRGKGDVICALAQAESPGFVPGSLLAAPRLCYMTSRLICKAM